MRLRADGLRAALLAAALVAATVAAFLPVARNGFIELDDAAYITSHPQVRLGLTAAGVRWALTALDQVNWQPLTWLAHMLVVQFGGPVPAPHHIASLALHLAAALVLLHALRAATGAALPAAFAAALFALHPQRVESVAWAAELKDVLCGALFLLAVAAHVRRARRPGPARALATAAAAALALAAKPMAVSLPLVLLLLDFWPLGRWRPGAAAAGGTVIAPSRLVREKLPLLALAAAAGAATVAAQARAGAVRSLVELPLAERLANVPVSLVKYLGFFLWPADLAVFYPLGGDGPRSGAAVAAAALLAAITAVALRQARRRPYLAAGWLWYLVAVAPVSGIVQAGAQGMADRYTYLPLIGVAVALVWGARDLAWRLRPPRALLAAGAAALLLALAAATHAQLRWWRDGATLFDRALAVTEGNWFAAYNAGVAHARQGRTREAIARYRASLAINPYFPDTWLMLGNALAREGDLAAAEDALRRALGGPHRAEAAANLGFVLLERGRPAAAAEQFRTALQLKPSLVQAREGLARALGRGGG